MATLTNHKKRRWKVLSWLMPMPMEPIALKYVRYFQIHLTSSPDFNHDDDIGLYRLHKYPVHRYIYWLMWQKSDRQKPPLFVSPLATQIQNILALFSRSLIWQSNSTQRCEG